VTGVKPRRFAGAFAAADGAGAGADWEKRVTSLGNGAAEVAGEEFSEDPTPARLGSFAVWEAFVEFEEFRPGGTRTPVAVEAAVPPAVCPCAGSPGGTVPIAVDEAAFAVPPAGAVFVVALVTPLFAPPAVPTAPRLAPQNAVSVAERINR
jgi:hypothetical protein